MEELRDIYWWLILLMAIAIFIFTFLE